MIETLLENSELVHMVLPYAVSTLIFGILGVVFYIKDTVFNFLDKKKQELWQRKYEAAAVSYKIKSVKDREKKSA